MAARENQGYLIAVILLVMATIVLAITTYFGFSTLNERVDQRDAAQAELATEQNVSAAWQAQAGMLKAYLGVEGFSISQVSTMLNQLDSSGQADLIAESRRITDIYEQDMSTYTNKDESVDKTYRGLLNDVMVAMSNLTNVTAILNNTVTETEEKLRTELAAKDTELAEKERLLNDTRNDLASEQQAHSTTRDELSGQLSQAENQVKSLGAALNQSTATIEQNQKQYVAELKTREEAISGLKLEVEGLSRTETDVADGQVVSVTSVLGKVVINLGYGDNLRPNQSFSIYDQSKTTFKNGEEKAQIEVTRIIDRHLAEARITRRSNTNPILARDFVVTTAWDPGYSVPIAIAGIVDLDGDSRSDLERLISIVQQNGGNVVAYVDEEGSVKGKIDQNTRLFVVGEPPIGPMVDGVNELKAQRDRYQVREISVRELLNTMGYRSEAHIQRFEDPDFVPRQPTTVTEGDAFEEDDQ